MVWLWTGRLISFAVALQSFELFFVREWPWPIVQTEFFPGLRQVVSLYRLWLGLRFATALFCLFLFPSPVAIFILVLTTWLIAIRWRGTFNGGSDGMTMVILLSWFVGTTFPSLSTAALSYIALEAVLSYVVAGVVKLRAREWRQGWALSIFLGRPRTAFDRGLGWMVIAFECLFPLSLLRWELALAFIFIGAIFHLIIVYWFGLNRFFFAWLASYPALYWASQNLSLF